MKKPALAGFFVASCRGPSKIDGVMFRTAHRCVYNRWLSFCRGSTLYQSHFCGGTILFRAEQHQHIAGLDASVGCGLLRAHAVTAHGFDLDMLSAEVEFAQRLADRRRTRRDQY